MQQTKVKQIARKKLISNILSAKLIKKEDWEPNHIIINGEKIYRVNIKGIIVAKIEKEAMVEYIIDDGTGSILSREFLSNNINHKNQNKIKVGDPVNVIAKISEFNNEIYLNIEAIKNIDVRWLKFHKEEINLFEKTNKPTKKTENEEIQQQKSIKEMGEEELKEEVINYINQIDKEEGGFIEEIIDNFNNFKREEIEQIIKDLLKNGDIFEYKKNYFKVL